MRLLMDGRSLVGHVPDGYAGAFFFDPQYRGVLDHLAYGNEGARQKARAKLPQMTDQTIAWLLEQASLAVRPSGHVFLWVDKFTIASGRHLQWLRFSQDLAIVDLFAWNKTAFGMGRRSRGTTEYLIVLQRKPTRAKGMWNDARLRDCWLEQSDKTLHPHAKPVGLIERLIRATTKRGELVVDPCAGGFGVLDACEHAGRRFLGCDVMTGEVEWLT